MDDVRAMIGCLCETCRGPVQVRLDPETGGDILFCVTCDIYVDADHLVDPCCVETRRAPHGDHIQICSHYKGHRGPHDWICGHPAPDGSGTCWLEAENSHADGHDYDDPVDQELGCDALVRTWPHGFNFRCGGESGHEGPHVADVSYAFNGVLDGYEARWVRAGRFVEHVPDEHGVRYVSAVEPPSTCGRCGSARSALGTVDIGVTAWRCDACAGELQYDVLCEQDDQGMLVRLTETPGAPE